MSNAITSGLRSLAQGAARTVGSLQQATVTAADAAEHQVATVVDRHVLTPARRGIEAAQTALLSRGTPTAAATTPATGEFVRTSQRLFTRLDSSGNGYISGVELAQAMRDPSLHGTEAAAVAALSKHAGKIADLADDERGPETIGISRADVAALDGTSETAQKARGMFWSAQAQADRSSRQLFPEGTASISSRAINQGRIGDCYFLSALAGLADADPAAIQRMVHDNGNGTYTVAFPGRRPVTVPAPTDAELGSYVDGGSHGLWVAVIEKAYAERRNDERLNLHANDYKATDGGMTWQGINALTGHNTTTLPARLTPASVLVHQIRTAQAEHRVMTTDIPHLPFAGHETNGFPNGHVYTVLGYDEQTRKIRIRNPWGDTGPAGDGVHEVSVADFQRTFGFVSIER